MTTADVVAALVAERYGPSLWWKTPEKTRSEEVAPVLRAMLLRATTDDVSPVHTGIPAPIRETMETARTGAETPAGPDPHSLPTNERS